MAGAVPQIGAEIRPVLCVSCFFPGLLSGVGHELCDESKKDLSQPVGRGFMSQVCAGETPLSLIADASNPTDLVPLCVFVCFIGNINRKGEPSQLWGGSGGLAGDPKQGVGALGRQQDWLILVARRPLHNMAGFQALLRLLPSIRSMLPV